jgi:hypothetical protein
LAVEGVEQVEGARAAPAEVRGERGQIDGTVLAGHVVEMTKDELRGIGHARVYRTTTESLSSFLHSVVHT